MAPKKKTANGATILLDSTVRFHDRKRMLLQLCLAEGPEEDKVLKSVLDAAADGQAESLYKHKLSELNELMEAMQKGPLRAAVFVRMVDGGGLRRAQIVLQDGQLAFTVVPDDDLAGGLRCGDAVLLDGQGGTVLETLPDHEDHVGEIARLERRIGRNHVEVSLRDLERAVYLAADKLIDKLDCGDVEMGSPLVVRPRQQLALDALPKSDGLSHYRYLAREPVPNVVVERDIGNPPQFIDELEEHLRMEMLTPDLGRRYRLRRSLTKLLAGVSGSGKTLSIKGCWRRMYGLMSEITGVPIDELPPRVLRLRMPNVLSKWLGDSDKLLDRFFDEVEQLADERFVAPDGTEFELPVLAICEEVEGLARTRGMGDPIYDRIQTTALERLDTNSTRLEHRLVTFLFTTNMPDLVDSAFLRRAGGTVERFGRLDRRSTEAVLSKHVRDLPLTEDYGPQHDAERRVVREITDWLFSPNGHDPGQVQLTYVGSTSPEVKYRRDLLTGTLLDRSAQQAARLACRSEHHGCERPGVTSELIIEALQSQVRTIVDQLTPHNVANYVTLPDGARVGDVRRIPQPRITPFQLERRA